MYPNSLGVRHETEAITLHAAELILGRFSGMGRGDKPLRIIDLCTGTGCIPLLLHNLLSCHFSKLSIIGIDISATAVSLAQKNVERNVRMGKLSQRALTDVRFQRRNVLEYNLKRPLVMEDMCDYTSIFSNVSNSQIDVLISNPPYVSLEEYHDGTTSRSVRIFEPKLALVPPENISQFMVDSGDFRPEDFFYHHIAALMCALQVKLGVLECGSRLQAVRVAMICENIIHSYKGLGKGHVNIWSDTGMDTDPCAVIMQTWD